jgi:transcriptional regulator with XRE-family HTH domain
MRSKVEVQVLDPTVVRHRRMELGLSASYLGALCGVSPSVIHRLEGGWPQDDYSTRFLSLLADNLGTSLRALLADDTHEDDASTATATADTQRDARELGAVLLSAREPVPQEALCRVFGWELERLDRAVEQLAVLLEPAGGALVDNGAALQVVDDIAPVARELVDQVAAATFARRRPQLAELRAVLRLIGGQVVRREEMDTAMGRTIGRLRNIGVLANAAAPEGVKADPPRLHADVTYSLMLDEGDVDWTVVSGSSAAQRASREWAGLVDHTGTPHHVNECQQRLPLAFEE